MLSGLVFKSKHKPAEEINLRSSIIYVGTMNLKMKKRYLQICPLSFIIYDLDCVWIEGK